VLSRLVWVDEYTLERQRGRVRAAGGHRCGNECHILVPSKFAGGVKRLEAARVHRRAACSRRRIACRSFTVVSKLVTALSAGIGLGSGCRLDLVRHFGPVAGSGGLSGVFGRFFGGCVLEYFGRFQGFPARGARGARKWRMQRMCTSDCRSVT